MAEVIEVRGGFAVKVLSGRLAEYVGSDGFWVRDPASAKAYTARSLAQTAANDLNDRSGQKWE